MKTVDEWKALLRARLRLALGAKDQPAVTILRVTHAMGFASQVADRTVFMDNGEIVDDAPPEQFFNNPSPERTRLFLAQILNH